MRLPIFFLLGKSINDLLTSKSRTTLNLYFNEKQANVKQAKQRDSYSLNSYEADHSRGTDLQNGNDIPWRRNFSNRVTFQMCC